MVHVRGGLKIHFSKMYMSINILKLINIKKNLTMDVPY